MAEQLPTDPAVPGDPVAAVDPATPADPVAAGDPVAPVDSSTEAPEGVDSSKATAEAARYRRQLREAQAERDSLRGRLTTMQTAEVERLATAPDALALGSDLWHSHTLDDFLDPAGNINPGMVRAAVADLLRTHPHYAHRRFTGGADGGVRTDPTPSTTWGSVLRG